MVDDFKGRGGSPWGSPPGGGNGSGRKGSTPPDIDEIYPGEYGLDFIIKSGRALIWPAFKGSLNRMVDSAIAQPTTEDQIRQFREMMVDWRVDTGRIIDYIEDRADFKNNGINYLKNQIMYKSENEV